MRRGEALSLLWSDIRNGKIHIAETKEGREKINPVSSQLQELLDKMGQNNSEKVVPFEKTYITRTFRKLEKEAGTGINIVQKLLGHAFLSTTSIYTKVLESSLKEDVEKLKWRTFVPKRPTKE